MAYQQDEPRQIAGVHGSSEFYFVCLGAWSLLSSNNLHLLN